MPWEKKFDQTQTLRRAMEAFWAHGYEATSMQDLVDVTGVNRASLYATYGDKRELFLASLREYDQTVRLRVMRELPTRFPPKEAITGLFTAFIEQLRMPGKNWGCMMTNTALELSAHDLEICSIVGAAQADLENFFREQIIRGQRSGEIHGDLDAPHAARGLLASLLGFLVLVRSRPEEELLNAVIEDVSARLS